MNRLNFLLRYSCCFYLILISTLLSAQNVDWLVQANITEGASALPLGNRVTKDLNGNVFMSSYATDEIEFGNFTATGSELAPGLYLNAPYLTKLNATGEVLWLEAFHGTGIMNINDIKADAAGNIYLLGFLDGQIQIGTQTVTSTAANGNIILAKLNKDGIVQWVDIGSSQTGFEAARGETLEITSNGNLIVHATAGLNAQYLAAYSSDGTLSWSRSYAGTTAAQIALDSDDNIYWVGYRGLTSGANFDIIFDSFTFQADFGTVYIGKFDSTGDVLWFKHYDATDEYEGRDFSIGKLAVDKNDNSVILGGTFVKSFSLESNNLVSTGISSIDFMLTKYNSNGDLVWVKQNHGPESQFIVYSMDTNNDGEIFITFAGGATGGTGTVVFGEGGNAVSHNTTGISNAFLAKYKMNGDLDWLKGVSDDAGGESNFDDVVAVGDNSAAVAGDFSEQLTLGIFNLTATPILSRTNNFIALCNGDVSTTFSPNDISNTIHLSPNPANQQVAINISGQSDIQKISITNSQGQLLYKKLNPQSKELIPLETITNGIYFITVETIDGIGTKKLVIH